MPPTRRQIVPTPGETVLYRLTKLDAEQILSERASYELRGNHVQQGMVFPAVIVRVWAAPDQANSLTACNLQVLLDGEDVHWVSSGTQGDDDGCWHAR